MNKTLKATLAILIFEHLYGKAKSVSGYFPRSGFSHSYQPILQIH
jgi:hypothetical protein